MQDHTIGLPWSALLIGFVLGIQFGTLLALGIVWQVAKRRGYGRYAVKNG